MSQRVDVVPVLDLHFDFNSGTTDILVTGWGLVKIEGTDLDFDDGDADQGVFWTEDGVPENRFRHTAVVFMTAIKIRIDVPGQIIPARHYICSVVKMIDGELREGFLEAILTGSA